MDLGEAGFDFETLPVRGAEQAPLGVNDGLDEAGFAGIGGADAVLVLGGLHGVDRWVLAREKGDPGALEGAVGPTGRWPDLLFPMVRYSVIGECCKEQKNALTGQARRALVFLSVWTVARGDKF